MLNRSDTTTVEPLGTEVPDAPRFAVVTDDLLRRNSLGADRYTRLGRFTKRLIDVTASILLLIVLSPLLVAIGLVIRMTSSGPALFRQTRVGFEEEPFTMLKFRTMAADNDESAHREFVQSMLRNELTPDSTEVDGETPVVFKIVDDPRVTKIGHWLRRTSLDELPQLVNILRGEMSLVGPRPCIEYEVSEFPRHHRARASSVPGMTGLWQVAGRNQLHMREALDVDLTYVETCNLRTDLVILARTVRVVAGGSGV